MTDVSIAVVAGVALLFWIALSLDRRRAWPGELTLSEGPDASHRPRLTVVVPARDEAAVLPGTLPTLLDQAWEGVEVLVVDDGSTDGTGEAARHCADGRSASAATLRIIRPRQRPSGWVGKVFALDQGVADAVSRRGDLEWLLFSDADIAHRPGSVAALLATAQRGPYDLVSVMARLHAESFWERLLIPPFVYFFHLLYPFRLVRRERSQVAAAAGGCVLVRRAALEAAGGLRAIRGAVIDDVSLAAAVKRAGGRLWLGLDSGITSVRPYQSLVEIWRMVARSAFVQLRYRWLLVFLVLAGIALFVASPPFLALVAGFRLASGAAAPWGLVVSLALAAWGLESLALFPSVRHHRVPWAYALTLPFASILYGLMTLTSALDHLRGRGSSWKGRSYVA